MGPLGPSWGVLGGTGQCLPVELVSKSINLNFATLNFFDGWVCSFFSNIVIDPKGYFLCDFNKFEDDVFEKNPLFCIPYLGQKRPFFGPEGPVLTQKLENIVKLVVTT